MVSMPTTTTLNTDNRHALNQNPETQPWQVIGVANLVLTTFWPPAPIALTSIPQETREKIQKLTGKQDGIAAGGPLFVDATLNVASIADIVKSVLEDQKLHISEYLVGSAGTQVIAGFHSDVLGKQAFTNPGLRTFVEVSVFCSPQEPGLALLQHLQSFDAPLDDAVQLSGARLGESSFTTSRSVFWVRSNVFVRVFASGLDAQDGPLDHLLTIARRLDEHMAGHLIELPKLKRPAPEIGGDAPETVAVGAKFTLRLSKLDQTLDEQAAEVDDPSVVQWLGPIHTDGRFEFMALKTGQTRIQMTVAHAANLIASVTMITVSVVESSG
ncbi:hypothetical protein LTR28_012403 [Elasticomyces elasticus]|nr:hypothetical protein LTR28_012403 [Elasticomyces elasticus]